MKVLNDSVFRPAENTSTFESQLAFHLLLFRILPALHRWVFLQCLSLSLYESETLYFEPSMPFESACLAKHLKQWFACQGSAAQFRCLSRGRSPCHGAAKSTTWSLYFDGIDSSLVWGTATAPCWVMLQTESLLKWRIFAVLDDEGTR